MQYNQKQHSIQTGGIVPQEISLVSKLGYNPKFESMILTGRGCLTMIFFLCWSVQLFKRA